MRLAFALSVLLISALPVSGQRLIGELRLQVRDASGAGLAATGTLESLSTAIHRSFATNPQGYHAFPALPLGVYRLKVTKPGFSEQSLLVEIRSEAPVEQTVTLGLAPIETAVAVRVEDTLNDTRRTGAVQYLGTDTLKYRRTSAPGRATIDLVNTQPGWLLEANGILHPRGSEYDVQYVVDGIPLYDNRSPAFAQSLGIDEFESLNIRTANYPAEFGRKLGGVIEVSTQQDLPPGLHGKIAAQGGSYDQAAGFASLSYSREGTSVGLSGEGMTTDRYLDPPVIENYTNHGSGAGMSARFGHTWSDADRTHAYFHSRRTGFLVPNEQLQQSAGQRQDRTASETLGLVSHSHVFSPGILAQVRAMVRDTSAHLWPNPLSTPIAPFQDRGFREGYIGGSLVAQKGQHELKFGGEALFSSIREAFSYHIVNRRISNVRIFDSDVPTDFNFLKTGEGRDQSLYAQDLWRRKNLTVSVGVRFDHYRLIENETAWSPRLGAAYNVPRAGLVLRASYDRVFQVPAIENILLASANLVDVLGGEGTFLTLKPSRGNFFEAGFSKSLFGRLRFDGTWYRRKLHNFADDSVLFNTGVSFPIAFAEGEVHGYEAKLDFPRWGPLSGHLSYSNMTATGQLPIAGGLFLGDDADELLQKGSFPITQDQRNTFRSRVRLQPHSRFWFAFGSAYNSGLPFELEGVSNLSFIRQQYGDRILSKVNFERGRVRPSASLDVSAGGDLSRSDRAKLRLQLDIFNLGDRLNLINFAGVLSGTAVDQGRSFAVRLNFDF